MTRQEIRRFARRLQYLRHLEGITQGALAEKLNISRSCLANYERGKRKPDKQMLTVLAQHFDVTIEYLIGKETADVQLPSAAEYIKDLKRVLPNGILDLSPLHVSERISVVDFFNYLQEREAKPRQNKWKAK